MRKRMLWTAIVGTTVAISAQARPPLVTELSFQKDNVAGPSQISQAAGERRLDKYQPYLKTGGAAQTEIAVFEEVRQPSERVTRPLRRDRIN